MQKIYSLNFVAVLFTGYHIRKAVAGSLLIVLLFIHTIKLLHTHSYSQIICKQNPHSATHNKPASESVSPVPPDCDICNYQLTKDADNLFSETGIHSPLVLAVFNTPLIPFKKSPSFSSFETRGPPAVML